jgi:hypothetical protein
MADGIQVNGQTYPILKMQWVNGRPLIEWLARRLEYPDQIATLAMKFETMCTALRQAGIAHGDLQHGNIIVSDDELKLVDYDAMFVPALSGLKSPELGHRHYQHPARSASNYNAELDSFSAASIRTSLHCLSLDPSLWNALGAGDECLLFRDEDYLSPLDSVAFSVLESHASLDVQRAAREFRALCPHLTESTSATTERQPLLPPVSRLRARPDVLLTEEQPRLRVSEPTPAPQLPASASAPPSNKVAVQVLPRGAKPKARKPNPLVPVLLWFAVPVLLLTGAVIVTKRDQPPRVIQHARATPQAVSDSTRNIALSELRGGNPAGLQSYENYIKLIQRDLSEDSPQRVAYNDLNALALSEENANHWNFALRVRELEFHLIKTARGPNSLTPREQDEVLLRILGDAANNRVNAGDKAGATIFTRTQQDAVQARRTNPLRPIDWPAQYATRKWYENFS